MDHDEITRERDAALREAGEMQDERDRARSERDRAREERDEAVGQRDEARAIPCGLDMPPSPSIVARGLNEARATERSEWAAKIATVTAERDQWRADRGHAIIERDNTLGKLATVTAERDLALGKLEAVTAERDEARMQERRITQCALSLANNYGAAIHIANGIVTGWDMPPQRTAQLAAVIAERDEWRDKARTIIDARDANERMMARFRRIAKALGIEVALNDEVERCAIEKIEALKVVTAERNAMRETFNKFNDMMAERDAARRAAENYRAGATKRIEEMAIERSGLRAEIDELRAKLDAERKTVRLTTEQLSAVTDERDAARAELDAFVDAHEPADAGRVAELEAMCAVLAAIVRYDSSRTVADVIAEAREAVQAVRA